MRNYPYTGGAGYDAWRTTPPDDDTLADEAVEQAKLDYLQDWIDGQLVSSANYSEPCAALADEPAINVLLSAVDDEELLAAAKEVRGALIREILGRAE